MVLARKKIRNLLWKKTNIKENSEHGNSNEKEAKIPTKKQKHLSEKRVRQHKGWNFRKIFDLMKFDLGLQESFSIGLSNPKINSHEPGRICQ